MQILNAAGEPYFGTAGMSIGESGDGDWFQNQRFEGLGLSCELSLGGAAITGLLYLEHTGDPTKTRGIAPVLLPEGCLHTTASGIALLSDRSAISLSSVANLATFLCSFSQPAAGWYRWRWTYSSGGSSPNKLFGYLEGKEGGD